MFFKKRPAFLHVGNIAHNAHYNARSLAKLHCHSDILIHDYYHYAACPEWLGLNDTGVTRNSLGNDFFPNFFKFGEAKSLRPDSYIQGPAHLALAYIWFRRRGKKKQAQRLWSILQFQRLKIIAMQNSNAWQTIWDKNKFDEAVQQLEVHPYYMKQLNQGFGAEQRTGVFLRFLSDILGAELTAAALPLSSEYLDDTKLYMEQNNLVSEAKQLASQRKNYQAVALGIEQIPSEFQIDRDSFDGFSHEDASPYEAGLSSWHEILKLYDQTILYATNPIFALLAKRDGYAAYEHGTIRTLPFEDSGLGRLTAESYRQAKVVFVTNADFVNAKPKLALDPARVIYIPHGFDRTESELFLEQNTNLMPPSDVILFIAPARHTWRNADDGNSKGNDKIIRAIGILAARGLNNFRVDFIDYGDDTAKTKELIADLKLSAYVKWLPTQTRPQLWRRYLNSHAVLDQFIIPAIGAIGVESLALGRRLINADNGSLKIFFNSEVPILGAITPEEIAGRMQHVIDDPLDCKQIGEQSKNWFAKYHDELHIRKQLQVALETLSSD